MIKRFLLFLYLIMSVAVFAQQSGDIMYFAEWADGKKEAGLSDRFTTGSLAVICNLVSPISYSKVFVQLDKLNTRTGKFAYYQRYEFNVNKKDRYVYFNDVLFDTPGYYRVFLLNSDNRTITSALIEIIEDYKQYK